MGRMNTKNKNKIKMMWIQTVITSMYNKQRMITMMMRIISDTVMSIMVILRMKWYHQRMSSNMDRMRMKMIITDSVVYCNGMLMMMMKRMICLVIRLQIIIIIIINNMMRMKMSNRMIINNKMIIHSHKRINMFLMMDRMNKIMMTVMMDMIMDSNSNNMTIRNRLSHRNIIRNNSKAHIIQCLKNIK